VCEWVGGLRLRCFSLVYGMCAFARVGVSAGVRRTNEQACLPCACKQVRMIGAQVSVGVCVRAVSACVRACRDERVAVVVGRRGLHV
jgi:hypothetical protein